MIVTIQARINDINDAIEWIKSNRKEHYEQRFMQLVSERCRLRKLAATEYENPAIAAFGESQKGKSYVISNLLSDNGKPFKVVAPDREYDFVKEINPITNDVEATGIVTRFTTFANTPGRYLDKYPVMIKLLGVAEIATILCDGYHSDITDYKSYSDSEMQQIAADIKDRYKDKPEIAGSPLVEDDIIDMKEYLHRCTGGSTQTILRSSYFDCLALVARRIPAADWAEVFSPLWHRNEVLTRLFSRLVDALQRLSYAHEVYVPIEAVLNSNKTLMSVQRINELGMTEKTDGGYFTDVVVRDNVGNISTIKRFDKSELSALSAEAVFKVEDRYLNSTLEYDMTMIDDASVRSRLDTGTFVKDIIADNDLLDFPGARARSQLREENLDKRDPGSAISNDAKVYLRGKVAYLFNRYSDSGLINILLFCHDHAQRNDDTLYITIENWVRRYVGDTPAERNRIIGLAGGISPFFLVATKFNIDMTMGDSNPDDVTNSRTSIDQRWNDRFNVVLYNEVLHGNDADWFRNWTAEGVTFCNTYLLRDYKYSGDNGKGNNLYSGFSTNGREERSVMPDVYFKRMRQSFIESPHVRRFFADPALSWDVAATMNNDGALYLFRQLAVAASNMRTTRRELTKTAVDSIGQKVYDIIKDYYHSDDAAKRLERDMNCACAINRELDFASNDDNYFFGRLINGLQTTERKVYNVLYELVNSDELNRDVNTAGNYEIIRKNIGKKLDRCSPANDNAQKWECLRLAWGLRDRAAVEQYLDERGVRAQDLFAGEVKRRVNSNIIAERVLGAWIDAIRSTQSIERLTEGSNFDPIVMTSLIDNIHQTALRVDLAGRLENAIAEFVNVMNVAQSNIATVADIMASIINDFVMDLGYSMRSDDELSSANRIIDDNPMRFDPLSHVDKPVQHQFDEEDLTNLFNRLYANPDAMTPAFENNYFRWIEFMIVSFLLKGDIIDYDVAANERLGKILMSVHPAN